MAVIIVVIIAIVAIALGNGKKGSSGSSSSPPVRVPASSTGVSRHVPLTRPPLLPLTGSAVSRRRHAALLRRRRRRRRRCAPPRRQLARAPLPPRVRPHRRFGRREQRPERFFVGERGREGACADALSESRADVGRQGRVRRGELGEEGWSVGQSSVRRSLHTNVLFYQRTRGDGPDASAGKQGRCGRRGASSVV